MPDDNKEVYRTVEFDSWAHRGGLIPSERILFEKYLALDADTVEAGTSGGRILLELQKRGGLRLWGFDYVPEFIAQAKKRDLSGKISFAVMDATQVDYPDAKFQQIIYLQQIVSLIESAEGRGRAVREAFRILRPGGTAFFSFLCVESRELSWAYRGFMGWIRILRMLRFSRTGIQYQPWLKLGGRTNWAALLDRKPHVYWFKTAEAAAMLTAAGFKIVAAGTDEQVTTGTMPASARQLQGMAMRGHLYFVCTK
jgi:SAM-dependent methyltransferase